ncbi:Putative papain-like cysteine peptidase [Paenibacillus sp. UNCCL117]|uniref:DUF1796 family putative cysteine peptidase n=1 Tax=unclassified Paenibacillus TaxID=185978 RepID=UPI00087FCF82|nr:MULTISPECIES: DUF1796 family putative cysteine peptidase [unclassified Paenibacillus]SDD30667.1 Putative papain-like cysteine peptidase [Paenibacillus sp. cl123]SFW40300.1 Putative papain-like cysteine peptidase [Paenibacillus sp. UNCCL117]
MKLRAHGVYDAVFSLGGHCLPSIELEKRGLRPYAGVLDWMISPYLSEVNRLLRNRFSDFMARERLQPAGYDSGGSNLMVEDTSYRITAAHHFPSELNTPEHLATYPEFRETLDRRIARTLDKFANSRRILFVRIGGSYQEAIELQQVLNEIVAHTYHVLLINYQLTTVWQEVYLGLEHTTVMALPSHDVWEGQSHIWDALLAGVQLVERA